MNTKQLLVAAAVAGALAVYPAQSKAESADSSLLPTADKNGCNGKSSCQGKDGQGKREGKKRHKDKNACAGKDGCGGKGK